MTEKWVQEDFNEEVCRLITPLGNNFGWLLSICIFYYIDVAFSVDFIYADYYKEINYFNYEWVIKIDELALIFSILLGLILPICCSLIRNKNLLEQFFFYNFLLIIALFSLISFLSANLLQFYFFFESILSPLYLFVGFYGTHIKRFVANFYFLCYTTSFSIFFLIILLYLEKILQTTNINYLLYLINYIPDNINKLLYILMFLPFGSKLPIVPFHAWLPQVHVEAPTIASIVLAALLLKLSSYGINRFLIALFFQFENYYCALILFLAIISIIFSSIIGYMESDLKRIIAYSSISHMNVGLAGIFSENILSYVGSNFLFFTHGIISTGLFFCIGFLVDRYNTRDIKYFYYTNLNIPIFFINYLLLLFGNISIPLTGPFIAELTIIMGILATFPIIGIIIASITLLQLMIFLKLSFRN